MSDGIVSNDGVRARAGAIAALLLMQFGVLAVYFPPSLWGGDAVLHGMDFWALHLRRIQFAHEAGSLGSPPGWYPRELLGTPYWSNLQNFPWIPNRLVLLALEPIYSYTAGVNLAAGLAALFTYLYMRAIGWGPAAAAVAGWTFACAGFFAARVTVGHLPLLEAYPTLPLLLWLAERSLQSGNRSRALFALAIATACTVVAGHPQLPAYAVAATGIYVVWVGRRASVRPLAAIGLGAATTLVVWWPMLKLLGRSTRTLALRDARNDLALPFERLASLVAPWRDGWPSAVHRGSAEPFLGFPSSAYFWDTHAYVGIVPWLVVLIGLAVWTWRRKSPGAEPIGTRTRYFIALGTSGLLLALPFVEWLGAWIPGTYLRSPARLLYLTTFSLSLAAGAGVGLALKGSSWARSVRLRVACVATVVLIHGVDVFIHDRPFVYARSATLRSMPTAVSVFEQHLGTARIAVDYNLSLDFNRRFEDIGFFDSIILARPYRALLALAGLDADTNMQAFSGAALSPAALANLGVRFVVTSRKRSDLPLAGRERYPVYHVAERAERVAWFGPDRVRFLSEAVMLEELAGDGFSLAAGMMLEPTAEHASLAAGGQGASAAGVGTASKTAAESVNFQRPEPDRIEVRVDSPRHGFVRILESWDPGWSATVDGERTELFRSDSFAMAVAVAPGTHRIELKYRTPGFGIGAACSTASLATLLAFLAWNARSERTEEETEGGTER